MVCSVSKCLFGLHFFFYYNTTKVRFVMISRVLKGVKSKTNRKIYDHINRVNWIFEYVKHLQRTFFDCAIFVFCFAFICHSYHVHSFLRQVFRFRETMQWKGSREYLLLCGVLATMYSHFLMSTNSDTQPYNTHKHNKYYYILYNSIKLLAKD